MWFARSKPPLSFLSLSFSGPNTRDEVYGTPPQVGETVVVDGSEGSWGLTFLIRVDGGGGGVRGEEARDLVLLPIHHSQARSRAQVLVRWRLREGEAG